MLNLFDFKNKLGKHKLVIFVLAGVFLFGFSLSVANAKTIDIGLINDYIHIPGRIGLGVTNPSYSLTLGGAGVGLQGTSTNILSLFTNSLERLTINADGNVGIGKTNPAATLDVNGQFNVSSGTYPPLNMVRTGTQTNIIQSGAQFKGKTTADMVDGYGVDLTFAVEDSANVNNFLARVGAQRDGADNSGALVFGTRSAGTNTDHMIIKSSGNVGIGITNPSAKLTVNGTTVLGNATQITPLGGSGNTIVMADNTGTLFSAPAGSSVLPTGTSGATIRHDGTNWISNTNLFNDGTNVGIGTTAPGYKLEVAGTNNLFTIRNASDTAGTEATLGFKMTSNLSTATNYAEIGAIRGSAWNISNIVFRTGNSGALAERIRISAAGNLGIGTSDPSARLTVNGATVLGGATQISSLGGGGNLLVMTDDAGNLYSTSSSAVIPEAMPIGTSGQTIRHDGGAWVANGNLFNNGTNIGIGTTNPAVKLTLRQGTTEYSQLSSAFDMAFGISSNSNLITGLDFKNSNTVGQTRLMARNNADDYIAMNAMGKSATATFFGQAGNQLLLFSKGKRMAIGTHDAQPLILGANNYERMRITGAGNVGIGTTNPSYALDVSGNFRVSGVANVQSDNDQILQLRQLGLSGTAGVKDPGWNYIAFQDSEGDRQAFFGVNSAGHFVFNPEITGSKIIAYSDFIVNASSFTQTGSSAQNSFAGNLGIGTNNPTARLTVNGATLLGGATSISSLGGSGNAIVMADNTGALYTSSGMLYNRTAVSNVAYTAQAADYIIAYTSLTANRVLTLPAALCTSGKAFVITNETNSAYSVVVTPDSGRLISGQTSISLPAYNSIPVYCNGTDWFIY